MSITLHSKVRQKKPNNFNLLQFATMSIKADFINITVDKLHQYCIIKVENLLINLRITITTEEDFYGQRY